MQNKSKKIFLSCLIVGFLFLFFLPLINVRALDSWSEMFDTTRACPCAPQNTAEKQYVRMQLNIPGITEKPCQYSKTVYGNNKIGTQKVNCYYVEANLPDFIRKVYNFSIGIIAIFAVMVTMIGGLRWILAGGNPGQIKSAQDSIKAAVSGLVLVLLSYTILNLINPKLTNLELTEPTQTEKVESGVIGQCRDLSEGTIVVDHNNNDKEFITKKDSAGKNIDDNGLECEKQYLVKDKYYTTNKQTMCFGQYCEEGICLDLGIGSYQCVKKYWSGKLAWDKDWYITQIMPVAICDKIDGYISIKNETVNPQNPQNRNYYAAIGDLTNVDNVIKELADKNAGCANKNATNFFLLITVQRGGWDGDDYYAIDKNCKLIKGDAASKDKPSKIKNWTAFNKNIFLTYDELKNYHSCDIYIDSSFQEQ